VIPRVPWMPYGIVARKAIKNGPNVMAHAAIVNSCLRWYDMLPPAPVGDCDVLLFDLPRVGNGVRAFDSPYPEYGA